MNQELKLQRPWPEVKEKLKEAKIELTDEDLHYSSEDSGSLLDRLSKKLKMEREEVKAWIESVSANEGQAS